MEHQYLVIETVGQEYYFTVKAESKQEAIEKIKRGEGVASYTKEAMVVYEAH